MRNPNKFSSIANVTSATLLIISPREVFGGKHETDKISPEIGQSSTVEQLKSWTDEPSTDDERSGQLETPLEKGKRAAHLESPSFSRSPSLFSLSLSLSSPSPQDIRLRVPRDISQNKNLKSKHSKSRY